MSMYLHMWKAVARRLHQDVVEMAIARIHALQAAVWYRVD
jgi:hypothetical protein